eukprot:CAMPEP_0113895288 /NCGR_PEP_ID=MMETSP0780_2-20120614/17267_1 /TAXON_ID=652834 /ORGANISM="Palpitomonas bilix" /LENGTH=242 /DNA_ID=CAMNT_0000886077 /DNA_START=55 /DNA_END=779 /DNA_ORIENTATION=+ /assembly_acc=CAM_ASM_000599
MAEQKMEKVATELVATLSSLSAESLPQLDAFNKEYQDMNKWKQTKADVYLGDPKLGALCIRALIAEGLERPVKVAVADVLSKLLRATPQRQAVVGSNSALKDLVHLLTAVLNGGEDDLAISLLKVFRNLTVDAVAVRSKVDEDIFTQSRKAEALSTLFLLDVDKDRNKREVMKSGFTTPLRLALVSANHNITMHALGAVLNLVMDASSCIELLSDDSCCRAFAKLISTAQHRSDVAAILKDA